MERFYGKFSNKLTFRATQDALGKLGAVEALIAVLSLLQGIVSQQTLEAEALKLAKRAIADGMQTLHFLCLMNRRNTAALAASRGVEIVRACELWHSGS